jgi:hypothetical protein
VPDRRPTDHPVNIGNLSGVDPSGCIQVFLNPFLGFVNDLVGDKGINNDTCDNTNQAGDRKKGECKLSFSKYFDML